MISEDDGNNSFLQKSEGQDEITEDSRTIPQTSEKDETTEDNTDIFETEITNTFYREGQQTQDNTHLSETSEMRDEIKEDYTEITNTFGTEGETTQDQTHISETSEMQDQTEKQDQTGTQDQREKQDQKRNARSNRNTISEYKLKIHPQESYTTEDQTKVSHREDGKERAKHKYLTGKVPQPKRHKDIAQRR